MQTKPEPKKTVHAGAAPNGASRTGRYGAMILLGLLLLSPSPVKAQSDFLTEDESARLRDAQDLLPRTEAYAAIAANRFAEIGRRMGKNYDIKVPGPKQKDKEKKPKKSKKGKAEKTSEEPENPLGFFQISDLLLAVSQSLQAVMSNVDERFQYKRAAPDEIIKSLELLQEFVSQKFTVLDDLEQKAKREEDALTGKAIAILRDDIEHAQDGAKEGLRVLRSDGK